MLKHNNNNNTSASCNLWHKLKQVLKVNGIRAKEKMLYKQKIGFDIIDNNK